MVTLALAVGADDNVTVCRAPYAGIVSAVTYCPKAAITGADTNSRTLSVINKGLTGVGATSVASKAFTNGVNAPAFDETAITLSGTPANLVVAEGDILVFNSLHILTGIADPGGTVFVDIARSYA